MKTPEGLSRSEMLEEEELQAKLAERNMRLMNMAFEKPIVNKVPDEPINRMPDDIAKTLTSETTPRMRGMWGNDEYLKVQIQANTNNGQFGGPKKVMHLLVY